jgi:hypothetical protein
MASYYTSCRTLTLAILILAATCLYVSTTYFEQSLVLRRARTDFAWWLVFTEFSESPQEYVPYKKNISNRKKVFFYAHYDTIGHCFIIESRDTLTIQVSKHDFNLTNIEPSLYAPVDDMPFWQANLNLRNYEPTKVTDLVLRMLQWGATQQGRSIDQDKILQLRLAQETLKRVKQLRGEAQFFGEKAGDSDGAPSLYRIIQKDFDKQKVKIPTLDLDFLAVPGTWIIVILTVGLGIMLRNQVSYLRDDNIVELSEPWIIFDANSMISRAMSAAWLVALSCAPLIVFASLLYMNFSLAWMNGFVGNKLVYVASGLLICLIGALGCQQIWTAAHTLNRLRRAYWLRGTASHQDQEGLGEPVL